MKIQMSQETCNKIMYWVDKADFEVSGFGTCKYADGIFTVTDAILLKQEGGATHTDIDPTALSKAQYELRNAEGDLRFWWHSHVNMEAFMSGTDTTTIKDIAKQGWCVAAVFNKRRQYQTAIGYKYETPFGGSLVHYEEKLPLELTMSLSAELIAELEESYNEHVTEKKWGRWPKDSRDQGDFYDWSHWTMYDKTPPATKKAPVNDITPEIAEEARILGIKPKKWLRMCNTLSTAELDMYFEAINRGMSITDYRRSAYGVSERALNKTY